LRHFHHVDEGTEAVAQNAMTVNCENGLVVTSQAFAVHMPLALFFSQSDNFTIADMETHTHRKAIHKLDPTLVECPGSGRVHARCFTASTFSATTLRLMHIQEAP
jgi:hypothetical protein